MSSVPNVSQTGMRKRVANAATPPMWSACSCVTRMALIDSGASPSRAQPRDGVADAKSAIDQDPRVPDFDDECVAFAATAQ